MECSGDNRDKVEVGSLSNCLTMEEGGIEQVLGIMWNPRRDSFKLSLHINLSQLKNSRVGPDLSKEELLSYLPERMSRRQYYS